jgi:hypothetical protein
MEPLLQPPTNQHRAECGGELSSVAYRARKDARFCCNKCRQSNYRKQKRAVSEKASWKNARTSIRTTVRTVQAGAMVEMCLAAGYVIAFGAGLIWPHRKQ